MARAALLGALGCSDPTGGDAAPVSGVVVATTAWGMPASPAGVTVRVEGTELSAQTDAEGRWELPAVPAGVHRLSFSKPEHGTNVVPAVQVSGAPVELEDAVEVAETPTFTAVIDAARVTSDYGESALEIRGHITEAPPEDADARVVIVYEGTSPQVGPGKGEHSFTSVSIHQRLTNGLTGEVFPPSAEFVSLFFVSELRARHPVGTKLYFVSYSYSVACSCYRDPVTDERLFTNVGPRGTVIEFTVP